MKIQALLHVVTLYIIFQLTLAFSDIAFLVCEVNPWNEILYVCINIVTVLFAVYLYAKYIMKKTLQELYLGKPLPTVRWCLVAVLIPVAICVFYVFFTKGQFCKENITQSQFIEILCLSVLSQGLRAGLTEEMIFRGMMFSSLQKAWGIKSSILISSLLFVLIHFRNIDTSDLSNVLSLTVAITVAGIALAMVTYQTGSIWSSVVIHSMYNILAGDSQIFHIGTEQNFPAIWTYTLESKSRLLTGIIGSSDLETALPSIVGFVIIIIIAAVLLYSQAKTIGEQE